MTDLNQKYKIQNTKIKKKKKYKNTKIQKYKNTKIQKYKNKKIKKYKKAKSQRPGREFNIVMSRRFALLPMFNIDSTKIPFIFEFSLLNKSVRANIDTKGSPKKR